MYRLIAGAARRHPFAPFLAAALTDSRWLDYSTACWTFLGSLSCSTCRHHSQPCTVQPSRRGNLAFRRKDPPGGGGANLCSGAKGVKSINFTDLDRFVSRTIFCRLLQCTNPMSQTRRGPKMPWSRQSFRSAVHRGPRVDSHGRQSCCCDDDARFSELPVVPRQTCAPVKDKR
jgi:hypothetical protein